MTPTSELRDELRDNVQEPVLPGMSDTDTAFRDAELDRYLLASGSIEEASWRAWEAKAVKVLTPGALVESQVGSERLKFLGPLDLRKAYLEEAARWQARIPVADGGATGTMLAVTVCGPEVAGVTVPANRGIWDPEHPCSTDASRLWTD